MSDERRVSMMLRDEGLYGAHRQIGVFIGRNPGSRGKAGQITVREDEWQEIVGYVEQGAGVWEAGAFTIEIGASLAESRAAFDGQVYGGIGRD